MIRFPECRRGDTWSYDAPITFESGSLEDCIITMTIKNKVTDRDSRAIERIDNNNLGGIQILDPTAPTASVRLTLTDEQTARFPPRKLYADIQIELEDGTTFTVENLSTDFIVKADVTRRTAL